MVSHLPPITTHQFKGTTEGPSRRFVERRSWPESTQAACPPGAASAAGSGSPARAARGSKPFWDPILGFAVNSPPILEPISVVGLGCSLGVGAFDPWPAGWGGPFCRTGRLGNGGSSFFCPFQFTPKRYPPKKHTHTHIHTQAQPRYSFGLASRAHSKGHPKIRVQIPIARRSQMANQPERREPRHGTVMGELVLRVPSARFAGKTSATREKSTSEASKGTSELEETTCWGMSSF